MRGAIDRARLDIEDGRLWKARDRLSGGLVHRQDDEFVDLLATVHHRMGDLPAAGALWFVIGRDDGTARAAIAAWQERCGDELDRYFSIPNPLPFRPSTRCS